MFDSPIADQRPGLPHRMGSPWHGLLEFPALQPRNATACPLSTVRLVTHGGKTLYPFLDATSQAIRTPFLSASRLFLDPRAEMADESESGEDWSGYLVISEQGSVVGEARMLIASPAGGIYHSAGANHIWLKPYSWQIRVRSQVSIARSGDDGGDYIDITESVPGYEPHHICDSTQDGKHSLFFVYSKEPSGLVRLTFHGAWPDITATSDGLMTYEETYTSEVQMTGIDLPSAQWRLVGARASCAYMGSGTGWSCGVQVFDEPSSQGDGTLVEPYSGTHLEKERWLATAHFDGDEVVPLWFEKVVDQSWTHDATWDIHSEETPGPAPTRDGIGALVEFSFDHTTDRSITRDWRLVRADGTVITTARLTAAIHQYGRYSMTEKSGGLYGAVPGEKTIHYDEAGYTHAYTLNFSGMNIFSLFPEFGTSELSEGPSENYPFYDGFYRRDTPSGVHEYLSYSISPHLYARDLVCMRIHCIHERFEGGQRVLARELSIYGTAYYKGASASGNFLLEGPGPVYGAGCPKTKKIARNYLYPVAWI